MYQKNGPRTIPILLLTFLMISVSLFLYQDDIELSATSNFHSSRNNPEVHMAFFFDPECPSCMHVKNNILPPLEENHTNLKVFQHNVKEEVSNQTLAYEFISIYNVPYETSFDYPLLFIGDNYFSFESISYESLSATILSYQGIYVPLYPEWNVSWSTQAALFYNSTHEVQSGGTWSQSLVESFPDTHLNKLYFDTASSKLNRTLFYHYQLAYGLSGNETEPVFFMGNDNVTLQGVFINWSNINETIVRYSGKNIPLKNVTIPDSTPFGDDTICVLVFHTTTCSECYKAVNYIKELEHEYPRLNVTYYNTANLDNLAKKEAYANHFDTTAGSLFVVIGDNYFSSWASLKRGFEDKIDEYPEGCQCPDPGDGGKAIKDRFESFVLLGILGAGLIDGVNPCAFVTLIFFISYLTIRQESKKDILLVGISFTTGIFVTYLLMGMGLYKIVGYATGLSTLSAWLYPITGLVALVLGIFSIYDYYKVKSGKAEDMSLQLPDSIKKLNRKVIRSHSRSKYFVGLAAFTGVVISLLEFMCTGQVYLPTIVGIMTYPSYRAQAFFYLVLYNLMFILPLVIILMFAYWGTSSQKMVKVFQKRLGFVKLLLAGLFFGLAIFMFFYSWDLGLF